MEKTVVNIEKSSISLEDRLNGFGDGIRQRLIDEFLKKMVRPLEVIQGRRYLKDDLAPYIVQRLEQDGVSLESVGGAHTFKEALYGSVNKEPMKRVYWGQFNANPPKEVMQELHPWVAFYFYAGVWARKSSRLPHKRFFPNNISAQNTYKMMYDCVVEGIGMIRRVHNNLYQQGKYDHTFNEPHVGEVMRLLQKPRFSHYSTQLTLL